MGEEPAILKVRLLKTAMVELRRQAEDRQRRRQKGSTGRWPVERIGAGPQIERPSVAVWSDQVTYCTGDESGS